MLKDELAQRIEHFLSDQPPGRHSRFAHGLAVSSSQGAFRDENQDRALIAHINGEAEGSLTVALVCDGMGGMIDGGGAAAIAASAFLSFLSDDTSKNLEHSLLVAINRANQFVYQKYRGQGGSTLSAIAINENMDAYIAHVGDSRIYVKRSNKSIELLTRDDTVAGQIRDGHSDSDFELDNRLLQFVGVGKNIEPHVLRLYVDPKDTYLITSDGGHSVGKSALERIFLTSSNCLDLVRKITYVADAVGIEDNSSAVALSLYDLSSPRQFYSGTSLSLWSASDQLEIWFEQAARQASQRPKKSMQPVDAPPRKVKVQKRATRPLAKSKADQKPQPGRPQLRIEFDMNGGGEND